MINEIRFALRMLRKHPGLSLVAILTLALGIGVNANLFGMVSAFFLNPMPVKGADRLVWVLQRSPMINLPYGHSYPDYVDYRQRVGALEDLLAVMPSPVHLSAAGQSPERTWIELVSPNCFSMLGVNPHLGRMFAPDEGVAADSGPVVVLTYRYWQRRFGGDPAIVGKTVALNGRAFTVIGVAPEYLQGIEWAFAISAFVPATLLDYVFENGRKNLLENRSETAWRLLGRRKPGVSLAQTRAEVGTVAQQLATDFPEPHKNTTALVMPETRCRPDPSFSDFLPFFTVMFAAMVCLVLFIACANVANLMLARALSRQKEMAVRSALGATRWQLIRQVLLESMLLGLIGGGVGFLLAQAMGRIMQGFSPTMDLPVRTEFADDWRMYAFTVLISLVAGGAAGLAPALKAARVDLNETLKETGSSRCTPGRHRFRNLLVVSQVAMALVVLICAGVFLRSLQKVKDLNLGFHPERLLVMSIDLGLQQYSDERGKQFCRRLLEDLKAVPGVESAGLTSYLPFDTSFHLFEVGLDENLPGSKENHISIPGAMVDQNYLKTVRTPLIKGRDLTEQDREGATRVAVINETMAQTFWPGQDAVGKRFRYGRQGPWVEVVGVAANGKYVMLGEPPKPFFYMALAQFYWTPFTLVVRTGGDPLPQIAAIRNVLKVQDPDLPIYNVRTMEEHLRGSIFGLMPMRMGASLAGIQGLIGLLLALMGLYAVVAYSVGQRTQEIGIRMALGAQPRAVLRLVVREGMRLTCIGIGLGLVGAAVVNYLLSKALYGIKPLDGIVFLAVTLLLLAVAGLACYWPARRAVQIDPMNALRCE